MVASPATNEASTSVMISRPPHIATFAVAELSGVANRRGMPICTSATSPRVAANDVWKLVAENAIWQHNQRVSLPFEQQSGIFSGTLRQLPPHWPHRHQGHGRSGVCS